MSQQSIHAFASAMDEVDYTFRQAGFFEQFDYFDRRERAFLTRLEDESIAADQRHRIHPERDHRWKVERGYADANAERLPNAVAVDSARDVLEMLSHQ